MAKYRVHLYPIVHVEKDVEAESYEKAAEYLDEQVMIDLLRHVGPEDFAEQTDDHAMIERLDDAGEAVEMQEYRLEKYRWYPEGEPEEVA